jgi:uncharacterized protein
MERKMTNKPKNVYEQLERILKRYGYKDLNTDFINGYLTAIACSPNTIEWHEWFDYLFIEERSKELKWQNSEDSDTAFDMLIGAYDELEDILMVNDYIPYISKGTENITHEDTKDWVAGFLYGTTIWDQDILNSDEELMRYVTSLHIYDNSDMMKDMGSDALEKAEKIQKEKYKNKPVEIIFKVVMSLYFRSKHNELPSEPIKVEPKINRNDPCPCGSGKKYKKCCGK